MLYSYLDVIKQTYLRRAFNAVGCEVLEPLFSIRLPNIPFRDLGSLKMYRTGALHYPN